MCTPDSVARSAGLELPPFLQQSIDTKVIRSKYRGLSWDKKHQGWRVRIYFAGKQRHVGRFDDDVTAAKAYDKAAVYLYGSNAITNFGLEACQVDPTEVSSFIIMAREQAEQEQRPRSQHRQQYALQHAGAQAMGNSRCMQLGPQHVYIAQQQQQPGLAYGMAGMDGACAWPGSSPYIPVTQGLQQQQQQMWGQAAGSLPAMLQQQPAQVAMPVAGGYAVSHDGCVMQAYPADTYVLSSGQGVLAPAAGALPAGMGVAVSGAMLLSPVQPQQHQPQHYVLQQRPPQLHQPMVAAGMSAAVSSAPAPAHLAPGGQQEAGLVLQQHNPAASADGSPLANGSTFVQDMLHSLNYNTSAGQAATAAMLQQQQGSLMMPIGQACLPAGGLGSSSQQQQPASWAMSLAAPGSGSMQGFSVSAGMADGSPSYSAASSTSANTSAAFALPRMCGASSAACA